MKHMKQIAIGTLLLLGVSGAAAQSLGDYAREVRKNKPEPTSTNRHFDNDNLPTGQALSVVGPAPAGDATAGQAAKEATVDPGAAARQKTADEWKEKLDKQKEKIASLNRDVEADQREVRLRAVAMLTDQTMGVHNGQGDKDAAQFKSDVDAKQKALDAAQQELNEMQERAHKAGVAEKDNDKDSSKDKDKDKDKDK